MQEAVHIIVAEAADLANHDPRKPAYLGGEFFMQASSGFALEYRPEIFYPAVQATGGNVEEVQTLLRTIAVDSIRKAMANNPGMIGGIILDRVRNAAS